MGLTFSKPLNSEYNRVLLFLGSRQYLLRSLYSDLQTLSSGPASDVGIDSGSSTHHSPTPSQRAERDDEIELTRLPTPVSATKSTRQASKNDHAIYSAGWVSRTVFSLVFTESCMMFSLLMLQRVGIFSAWFVRLLVYNQFNSFMVVSQDPSH